MPWPLLPLRQRIASYMACKLVPYAYYTYFIVRIKIRSVQLHYVMPIMPIRSLVRWSVDCLWPYSIIMFECLASDSLAQSSANESLARHSKVITEYGLCELDCTRSFTFCRSTVDLFRS